jgi:hypothetical protein
MAATQLERELERSTLERWCEQSSVGDIAAWYDELREAFGREQEAYADARWKHDHAAAGEALAEQADLISLLAELREQLDYRRGLMVVRMRPLIT